MKKLLASAALLLTLTGCESFLSANSAEMFPPPGRLVDIGGRLLQLDCRGSGSPTVLLESGRDGYGSLSWAPIQDEIAATTRVCAYSHAGMMWSDSRREALTTEGVARDLRAALQQAGEAPPFVLVGHSRGAIYNLIFNDLFDADVAAFVFLDPRHPEIDARRLQAGLPATGEQLSLMRFGRAVRWTGLLRLYKPCALATVAPEVNAACNHYYPHTLDGYISEDAVRPAVEARGAQARNLGDKPVIVLTRQIPERFLGSDPVVRASAEKSETLWRELNAEYATWSTRGEQRVVPDTNHQMMISHPASVAAVKEIVLQVRGK